MSKYSPTLSILVPLYNEEEFIEALLRKVMEAPLPAGLDREVIVVDDGSDDGSGEVVQALIPHYPGKIRLVRHERNRGKGAAVRTALKLASGEFTIIQDADLEYDPREYARLLKPLLEENADVVYGSRFMIAGERRVLYFWHALANWVLTQFCNLAADLNLTDMGTCYKAFRTSLLKSIPIRSDRFGIEPELTIKLARREVRIYETPINYHGRTYDEGKKIGFWDAVAAFGVIMRYWFTKDLYNDFGPAILDAFAGAPRFNRWMADTIRPYVGRRVLEIGAGMGNLTRNLAPRRTRYIATDIDPEHLGRLRARLQHRPNVEIRLCNLENPEDFNGLGEAIDSVVCLNVLEHIGNDHQGLLNIRSVLAPGGRAVILVPEGQNLYCKLDEVLGHFRRYSEDELRKKMTAAGFRVETVLKFNRVSRPGWYVNGVLLGSSTVSPAQLKIFDRTVWFWRKLDWLLPWKPISIIGIGVKE